MLNLNHKIASRTVRVFLSSTFRDMEVERRHLINTIFPVLRSKARVRKVELTEVDLRWGITDSDAQSGNTVRLCLNEIDECRRKSEELPFFIGLLGGRYGWVPTAGDIAKDSRLRSEFKAVDGYVTQRLSVTEMEMRHAVLERVAAAPAVRRQSYFFFRDPSFTDALRSRMKDMAFTDDQDPGLPPGEKKHAAERLPRLRRLIEETMEGNPSQVYSDEKDLGDRVSRAFTGFLDAHFPQETPSGRQPFDPATQEVEKLDEEQRLQALFAQGHIAEYVDREGWNEKIASIESDTRPAVITGAAGSGKTTLMAVAIARMQRRENAPEALYHFCGGTADAGRLAVMLRRLIAELQRVAGQEIKVPSDNVQLPTAMINALYSIPAAKKVLLAIDALDQLDDHKNLAWLPPQLPKNVQLLASVKSPVDGKQNELLVLLARFSPRLLEAGPLTVREREAIIEAFLKRYGKRIDAGLLGRIAADRESETPLVLRALLEEMRLIGDHHALAAQIGRYIETDSNEAFFGRVLERIERDFSINGDSTRGAAEILALISAAQRGLSETEILELMNPAGAQAGAFTPLQWAGLHEVLRPHVKEQNGCLAWSHDLIKRAAGTRYAGVLRSCQKRLAEYFLDDSRMLAGHALQEWPWHLRSLDERERMEGLFRQGKILAALLKENEGETHGHWLWLAQGEKSPADWIAKSAEQWVGEEWENLWDLEELRIYLTERVGRPEQAVLLGKKIVDIRVSVLGPDALDTISAKHNLANSFYSLNRHEEAMKLREEVLEQSTRILGPDALFTVSAKNGLATSCYSLNRHIEALKQFEDVVEQYSRLFGPDALSTIMAKKNVANTYASLDRLQEALKLGEGVLEEYTRLLGSDALDTITAKNNLASTYSSLKRHQEALKLKEEVLEQRTRLLGPDALDTISAKNNLANTYDSLGRHEEALKLKEEVLEQDTRLLGPDALNTIIAMNNLACTYSFLKRHQEALKLQEEVVKQYPRLLGPDALDTISAKNNLAFSYSSLKRHEEALKLQEEVVKQYPRLLGPDALGTITAKNNLASTYSSLKRHQEAQKILEEVVEQYSRLLGPDALDTIMAKYNLAVCYSSMKLYQKALKLFKEVIEQWTRVLGSDSLETISAKHKLAFSYSSLKRPEEALKLEEEVLEQSTRLLGPDALETITVKNNLAALYSFLNRPEEALKLQEKENGDLDKMKSTCQVCKKAFYRNPIVESYGGRLCPSCYNNDPKARDYFHDIYYDESDLVDHVERLRQVDMTLQDEWRRLEKEPTAKNDLERRGNPSNGATVSVSWSHPHYKQVLADKVHPAGSSIDKTNMAKKNITNSRSDRLLRRVFLIFFLSIGVILTAMIVTMVVIMRHDSRSKAKHKITPIEQSGESKPYPIDIFKSAREMAEHGRESEALVVYRSITKQYPGTLVAKCAEEEILKLENKK
jgi:tetratricopeptide (TPR) repeat protein